MADRRPTKIAAGVAALLVAGGVGFWAGRTTLSPTPVPAAQPASAVVVDVTEATVGKTYTWATQVTQPKQPVATNLLSGVVTAAGKSGSFDVGDTVYAVDQVRVRVVEGTMPFYRDLAAGSRGRDVRQLNNALRALKLLTVDPGDRYTAATARAVRAWEAKLGTPPTGRIGRGQLVAVRTLPTKLFLDAKALRPGATLGGGEVLLSTSSGVPEFTMLLNDDQARLVPEGAHLTVQHEKYAWKAGVAETTRNDDGQTVLHLASPDGGSVCGKECGALPASGTANLMTEVEAVPPATGPAVPLAAIRTLATGRTVVSVVGADGVRQDREVTAIGSQGGIAVVTGVTVGERVQVIGGPDASATPAGATTPAR